MMSLHAATDFLARPLVASSATLSSVVISLLPHLESGMRLGTLGCGLLIGLLALRKSWRDRHK
jgi:hypothetical protein